jgi:hypothetical protein
MAIELTRMWTIAVTKSGNYILDVDKNLAYAILN